MQVQPASVHIDSGSVSEAAIKTVETNAVGLTVLAAVQREPHGRTVAPLEKRDDPPTPTADASFAELLRHRTATAAGRALFCKLRQQTVELVFGIAKEAMGFHRFSLRGLAKVSLECDLVCLAYKTSNASTASAQTSAPW